MDAWTVYWLFQLDSINMGFTLLALAFLIAFMWQILVVINAKTDEMIDYTGRSKENTAKKKKALHYIWWVAPLLYMISCLIPSTKTMAAIIVLPKIASAENLNIVSKDAGDIYKLAMARVKESLGEASQ
jgi:heme/copper-type cytochrome/quinol oxidase subunit 2